MDDPDHLPLGLVDSDAQRYFVRLSDALAIDGNYGGEHQPVDQMRGCSRKGKQFPVVDLLCVIEHHAMNVLLILFLLRVFGRRISEVLKELVVDPLMQQEKGGLGALKNCLQVVQKLHDIVEGALHLQQGLQARREFLQLNDVHIVMMKLLRLDARAMLDGRVKMLVIVNLTH